MSFIFIYILFAVTTGLTSLLEILMPVIGRRRIEGLATENTLMTYLVFFCMATILAPLLFLSCIIPSMGERFRSSLYDGLYPQE
jgi:uncharacterized membrane protein YdjX (TVP38/TMEM64 family)